MLHSHKNFFFLLLLIIISISMESEEDPFIFIDSNSQKMADVLIKNVELFEEFVYLAAILCEGFRNGRVQEVCAT